MDIEQPRTEAILVPLSRMRGLSEVTRVHNPC